MPVLRNIAALAQCPNNDDQSDIGLIQEAAVAWEGDSFTWVGKESELPPEIASLEAKDAAGCLFIPGLIDCHTHLCFGGWRADEFEMRLLGKSYLEIAKAGGGILSTMKATRSASKEELLSKGRTALRSMLKLGVTTVECKSGYGLDKETELEVLRVYKELNEHHAQTLVSTYLGAHVLPPEFKDDCEGYFRLIEQEVLPVIQKEELAQFCDVFVEDSAFNHEQARKFLDMGRSAGLELKLHVDQLSASGGAELAAEYGAVSADHLEQISDKGIKALAESGTIAVSLPLASLYTQQAPLNARRLIDGGVPVAVATDFNPGSAPSYHLPLAMMLSCNLNRLSPAEALKAATTYAARAIGLADDRGTIEVGKRADFCLLSTPSVNHWLYHFEANSVREVYIRGSEINNSLPERDI